MTSYTNLLMSLTRSSPLDSDNMQQLIEEGLYLTPSLFSVDRAALWLLDNNEEAYLCKADTYKGMLNSDPSNRLAKKADNALFQCLQSTTEIIINNHVPQQLTATNIDKILSVFQVCSILLIPLHINGKSRGFIFLGDSKTSIDWSPDILIASRTLAQLFTGALLAIEHSAAETKLKHQHQLMAEIETLAKVGGWDYEIATGKTYWTDETYRIYGLSPSEEASADRAISFYSPEAQCTIKKLFDLAIHKLEPYQVELPFSDVRGIKKWVRTTGQIRTDDQGIATHIYGAFEDITAQKKLLDSEKSTSENLKTIVDNLNDSIVTISSDGIILSANRVVKKTFGYSENELIGQNVSILMPEPFASKHQQYMSSYLKTGQAKIIGIGRELPAMKKDGTTFPMELSISEVLHGSDKVFIGIVRDITERQKAQQDIHQLAYFDDTTGVMNRYSFERDFKKCFEKSLRLNESITAMLINLDKFSQVNLIYGDDTGDAILKATAQRLNERLPSWATIYRNSADSFNIILHDINRVDETSLIICEELAYQILQEINQPIIVNHNKITVEASIGIVNIPAKEINYIDIKPLLELAVVNAKRKGGNSYVFANYKDINLLKRQSELSLAMKCCQFTSELSIVLQPQYSTQGDIVGSEALVRWQSPSLGFVSPAEFISLAEKSGTIIALGNWMLNEACALIAQKRLLSKKSSPVSVNISAKQIAQPNFIDNLLLTLDKYQIPYSELLLELTESALVSDLQLVVGKMELLKIKGILFSIDDFGTGYSSLSYIHHLPITELKVDKCFVDDIKNEFDEVPIINTILQMAKSLKLRVVAEGVESEAQLNYLAAHDCDVIQGYYFSKPLSSSQWLALWQDKH
ncbi:bifunctional diguanylate cyclase/phosphodiesterase [Colwellia ponticola]|uniref:Sensor protein FixL n=1 Tax=Colwellia ponticola TaxID=2304625 RepID=A0A8H2PK53_9GAMM|nr:EAL domain-containing protein [Colwellia ponticola]TMM45391.1 EAL domain-containing protein [Colwellia ponticola]